MRGIEEATEASKKAAREAAEASVRVFRELIGSIEDIGKMSQPVARQFPETPTGMYQEGGGNTTGTDGAAEEAAEVPARRLQERPGTVEEAGSDGEEAAEVLEHFQWSEEADSDALAEELADVALYLLQLAYLTGLDLEQAILDKLAVNYQRDWSEG